jgi:CRISPR-associated protein Cas1
MARDGMVEYVTESGGDSASFNIPYANTSLLLLGPECSITTEAARILRSEGTAFGFCGGGGAPLLTGSDNYPDLQLPADEYRDPAYAQRWYELWRDDGLRLGAAKMFLRRRLELIESSWAYADARMLNEARRGAEAAKDAASLLGVEGSLTRKLYRSIAKRHGFDGFERERNKKEDGKDPNPLLDQGNYVAYGLASVVLWALGIQPSFPVLHDKTRRGGLVFDLADCIKDAIVLPCAFEYAGQARSGAASEPFRAVLLGCLHRAGVLDLMFQAMKDAIEELAPEIS